MHGVLKLVKDTLFQVSRLCVLYCIGYSRGWLLETCGASLLHTPGL